MKLSYQYYKDHVILKELGLDWKLTEKQCQP